MSNFYIFRVCMLTSRFTNRTINTTSYTQIIIFTLKQLDIIYLEGHVVLTLNVTVTSCKIDVKNRDKTIHENGYSSWQLCPLKYNPNQYA